MATTTPKRAPARKTPVAKAVKAVVAAPAKTARPVKAKPTAKPAAKPAAKAPAKPVKPAKEVKAEKLEKARKPKLVRDSFTIPKNEYAVLQAQKDRATKLTRPAKKSEILRAGVAALAAMSDVAFLDALARVPAIKTGRPGKD